MRATEAHRMLWEVAALLRDRATASVHPLSAAKLRLLAEVLSLHFNAQSSTGPFEPFMTVGSHTTFSVDDLTAAHLSTLRGVASKVTSPRVRARLADVLWLRSPARDRAEWAVDALDNYIKVLPTTDRNWWSGGSDHVLRSIDIALRLGRPGRTHLGKIELHLVDLVLATDDDDGWLPLHAADVLLDHRLARPSARRIAQRLATGAARSEATERRQAREYASGAIRWWRLLNAASEITDELVRVADLWLADAAERARPGGSYLAASHDAEQALKALRQIPRAHRERADIASRTQQATKSLSEYSARGLDEMTRLETDPIDLTDAANEAIARVTGKDPGEALAAFCDLAPFASESRIRSAAEQSINAHPFGHLFPKRRFASDGRIVYTSPSPDAEDPRGEAEALRAEMIQQHGFLVHVMATGAVLPALDAMRAEHLLRESDFIAVCRASSVVPADRERLIARGLLAGYERDLGTALHLLAPQLENLVRQHLKAAGFATTRIDTDNGVESEVGLSKLMEGPEAETVFGANIAFEIRALFTDPLGFNLRNEIAHGLIADTASFSTASLYAWWFVLRLVYLPFWNRANAASPSA